MSREEIENYSKQYGVRETTTRISDVAGEWLAAHTAHKRKHSKRRQRQSSAGIPPYEIILDAQSERPRWFVRWPKSQAKINEGKDYGREKKDKDLGAMPDEVKAVVKLMHEKQQAAEHWITWRELLDALPDVRAIAAYRFLKHIPDSELKKVKHALSVVVHRVNEYFRRETGHRGKNVLAGDKSKKSRAVSDLAWTIQVTITLYHQKDDT